ncbi:MAG: amino acid ABC transporter substrate-binding protein [Oscillatoriales cyanobacterium]|nr:MAG: amino acid ABC transporter substrate-binding protein [Oscillatoriales cyanobacterium]
MQTLPYQSDRSIAHTTNIHPWQRVRSRWTQLCMLLCPLICMVLIAITSFGAAAIAQDSDTLYYNEWGEPILTLEAEPTETVEIPNVQTIIERGVLRVGMPKNDNFPFYSKAKNSTKLEGIDSDFATGLAQELGVTVEYVRDYDNHDAVIAAIAAGEVDCGIAKLSRTPERGIKVIFTQPYLKFRQALLVNQRSLVQYEAKGLTPDQVFDRNLTDSIAVLDGTSYVSFAKQLFPKAKLLEYPTWEDVVQAVLDRKALAAFRDEVEVRSIVLNHPELAFQLKSILVADSDDGKGIAIAPENILLKEVANLYIDNYARPIEADTVLSKITEALESKTPQS